MALLDGARVTDVHCHGFRLDDVRARAQEGFLDRITMLGMCLTSSGLADEKFEEVVTRTTDTSPFAVAMALRLGGILDCEPTREALAQARGAALEGGSDYLERLWADAGVAGLIVDDGYPLPAVNQDDMARETGLPISRVSRIEPWIATLREDAASYAELEDAFTARAEQAIADGSVAFKSVIAYRTGLDIRSWSSGECESAFRAWRASEWAETRDHAKPVRDMLLRRTLAVAGAGGGVPVHIHCGGGDPSVVLAHVRPTDIFPMLHEHLDQPIVLIHSGWPWVEEGAFVASILPHVYLDTSLSTPLASLAVDSRIELLLGIAPPAKVLYGSDESTEPEVIWLSSVLARESLERVLARAIDNGYLDERRAAQVGLGVLGENARRLHGIEGMVG